MNHTNLNSLPKLKNCISFLYIDTAHINQDEFGISIRKGKNTYSVPITNFSAIFLGFGTTITHAAIKNIADAGTQIIWVKHDMSGFYTAGNNRTNSAKNLITQAKCFSDKSTHIKIAKNMYQIRYPNKRLKTASISKMMGAEGLAVQAKYKQLAEEYGIEWNGRDYKEELWDNQSNINRAISITNSILYDLCLSFILILGFSPDLGFIHIGKSQSFVYDIADLYKEEISFPVAFEVVSKLQNNDEIISDEILRNNLLKSLHQKIKDSQLLKRFPNDIKAIFNETGYEVYVPHEFSIERDDEYFNRTSENLTEAL